MSKMQTLDDELDSIPTTPPTITKPTPTAAAAAPTADVSNDDDTSDVVDLIKDREKLLPGDTLSSIIPKEKNVSVRFALVPGAPAILKMTHFLQGANGGKGTTVLCIGADKGCPECPNHEARKHVAILVVKYSNADKGGKFPAGTKTLQYEVGFIRISPSAYNEMSEACSDGEDLYSCDFSVSLKTNQIGHQYSRKCSPPSYKKVNGEAEVLALAKPYMDGKLLKTRLGKKVTALEIKLMLGESLGGDAKLEDLGDL
jgi:hypothetical protein